MANWILQGNPGRSQVEAVIAAGRPIGSWAISRHVNELAEGDRAALWVSGKHAGIYVLGRISGPSFDDVADDTWAPGDRGHRKMFAAVILDDFLSDPLAKAELAADPVFARARILRQPQAGNPFLTTDDEWEVIERLRGQVSIIRGWSERAAPCRVRSCGGVHLPA